MKFGSDLDVFYNDFGVDAFKADGSSIKVILDEPDQESLSLINDVSSQIRGKKDDIKALKDGDSLTIDDAEYTVKYVRGIDDGIESIAYLSKA